MPSGGIRFGYWLFRLIAWDSLLPAVVVLMPALIQSLLPNNRLAIEITAMVLPIAAFFIRFLAGRRHIVENNCSVRFRRIQFRAFFFGLLCLAVIDAFVILSHVMPKGAGFGTREEWIAFSLIYFPPMVIAMYPGRAWSAESDQPGQIDPQEIIDQVRVSIGPAPRRFNWWSWLGFWSMQPRWLHPSKPLCKVYHRKKLLLEAGEIVWAAVVQANPRLFHPGSADLPALVVYAVDQSFDSTPQWLQAFAHWMFQLKNSALEDDDQRQIEELVACDMSCVTETILPKSCTHEKVIVCSATMVFRNHLPGGLLRGSYFPIFVHPETAAVMIVPRQFWPEWFARQWKDPPQ